MIHHCPRCELRFSHEGELNEHLVLDHAEHGEDLERLRYPERGRAAPLYPAEPPESA